MMQSVINMRLPRADVTSALAMTSGSMVSTKQEQSDIVRIASLVAIASVLQISESLIPHPVPGVRLGLANMITLVTLVHLGFKRAIEVSVLRTVVSSLVLGTFLTPTFILSFVSAVVSSIVMGIFYWISSRAPRYGFSLIGISLLGAASHNLSQLVLAYYLMIKHPSIFYFLPWLMLSGVIMGWLTGLVAVEVSKRLSHPATEKDNQPSALPSAMPLPSAEAIDGKSFLHRLAPEWKILTASAVLILILFLTSWFGYLMVILTLFGVMVLTRLPVRSYVSTFSKVSKMSSFIVIAFSFPILFSSGSNVHALVNLGPLKITEQGFITGSIFALRIICMMWVTLLLGVFTSPQSMAEGIKRVLVPFRLVGLPSGRIASIIAISWNAIPIFWTQARSTISQKRSVTESKTQPGRLSRIRNLIPFLSDIITNMYRQGEHIKNEEK